MTLYGASTPSPYPADPIAPKGDEPSPPSDLVSPETVEQRVKRVIEPHFQDLKDKEESKALVGKMYEAWNGMSAKVDPAKPMKVN
jgi:hypothetical protein